MQGQNISDPDGIRREPNPLFFGCTTASDESSQLRVLAAYKVMIMQRAIPLTLPVTVPVPPVRIIPLFRTRAGSGTRLANPSVFRVPRSAKPAFTRPTIRGYQGKTMSSPPFVTLSNSAISAAINHWVYHLYLHSRRYMGSLRWVCHLYCYQPLGLSSLPTPRSK